MNTNDLGVDSISGKWWRWTCYQIINGSVGAADGASLVPHDPWESYISEFHRSRSRPQPYLALLELDRTLRPLRAGGIEPSGFRNDRSQIGPPSSLDLKIMEWCGRNGMLGVLPGLTLSLRLYPKIESTIHEPSQSGRYLFHTREYMRAGAEWFDASRSGSSNFGLGSPAEDFALHSREVLNKLIRDLNLGMTVTDPYYVGTTEVGIDQAHAVIGSLALYSRRALEGNGGIALGLPGSDEFWADYCEPLWMIDSMSRNFTEAVEVISEWTREKFSDREARREFSHKALFIRQLARGALEDFVFDPRKDTIGMQRISPSLLSSYALMFLRDRLDGKRTKSCGRCGKYFVSNYAAAKFCGENCKNAKKTAEKREWKRDAIKLWARGMNLSEIAVELKRSPEAVTNIIERHK